MGAGAEGSREPFFGRDSALADLGHATEIARLVTVTGPPGVGKTRLVEEWLASHQPGRFVDLTSVRTLDEACARAADRLEVSGASVDRVIERVGEAIRARGLRVLALDNCEQIVPAARELTRRLVPLAPETAFVLTSRQPLRVRGERVLPLAPLEGGEPGGPGVELLVSAAVRAGADPDATRADPDALREIVRLSDGLPLALELAAARLTMMSPATLRDRLRDRLVLLSRGPADAPTRQTSLESAIGWSWDLLSAVEKRALAECSMFSGGFTLDAAEAIVTRPGEGALIDLLQSLHDQSLLMSPRGEPGRFAMLLSIRDFAAARLAEMELAAAARRRYVDYWTARATEWDRAGPGEIQPRRTLILQVQGGWFQLEGAAPVSCSRWKLLQRLLVALTRARVEQPGQPVTARTLLAAGWPEESILARAARNRLHVALHRLRRLGLHEVIVCETGGWLLSRQFDLELRDVPCPEGGTSG